MRVDGVMIGYGYGKRTSILQDVAISVKKVSVFVVLHGWGTGTLLERQHQPSSSSVGESRIGKGGRTGGWTGERASAAKPGTSGTTQRRETINSIAARQSPSNGSQLLFGLE